MGMKTLDSRQSMTLQKADLFAFDRLSVVQPFWTGFDTAANHVGLDEARVLASRHTDQAAQFVEDIGGDNTFLLELISHMLKRGM